MNTHTLKIKFIYKKNNLYKKKTIEIFRRETILSDVTGLFLF